MNEDNPVPKRGDIVRIVLYDHADFEEDDMVKGGVLVFEAFGRLICETDLDYRIAHWMVPGVELDHNNEYYSIVKGAVKSIKVLK